MLTTLVREVPVRPEVLTETAAQVFADPPKFPILVRDDGWRGRLLGQPEEGLFRFTPNCVRLNT